MGWVHDHLGIAADADERAIKRAYAAKLRSTRPDEDPEGFQRLNEAYRRALDMAAWRREIEDGEDEDGTGDDHASADAMHLDAGAQAVDWHPVDWHPVDDRPAQGLPAPPPAGAPRQMPAFAHSPAPDIEDEQGARFDFDAFFEALEVRIHGTYPSDFALWLERHPALQRASVKRGVAIRLPRFLEQRPTLPAGHVDALISCFGHADEETMATGEDAPAFDLDRFLERLEIEIHRTKPIPFRHWLDRHPALYDVSLKQAIAADVVDFMERHPRLPRGHVEALLSFFGLDRVSDDDPFLQHRVQAIMHHIAAPGPIKPKPREESGGFPIFWIIFMVLTLGRCAGGFSG